MQPFDQTTFTNAFIRTLEVDPTEDQLKAISLLSAFISGDNGHRIFLLKGYAGTGKTTLMAAITKIIPRFILLAPTGRAAKVLSGYSGFAASTIHRHIYKISSSQIVWTQA